MTLRSALFLGPVGGGGESRWAPCVHQGTRRASKSRLETTAGRVLEGRAGTPGDVSTSLTLRAGGFDVQWEGTWAWAASWGCGSHSCGGTEALRWESGWLPSLVWWFPVLGRLLSRFIQNWLEFEDLHPDTLPAHCGLWRVKASDFIDEPPRPLSPKAHPLQFSSLSRAMGGPANEKRPLKHLPLMLNHLQQLPETLWIPIWVPVPTW